MATHRIRVPTEIEYAPEAMGNLSRLQVLDLLVCTKLKALPSAIGELANLKSLFRFV